MTLELGRQQVRDEIGSELLLQRFIQKTGIYGLTYVIQAVLDEHYPADIFGDGKALYPTWASEHGGEDIDPGIKWVALLRHAIKEVARDEPA